MHLLALENVDELHLLLKGCDQLSLLFFQLSIFGSELEDLVFHFAALIFSCKKQGGDNTRLHTYIYIYCMHTLSGERESSNLACFFDFLEEFPILFHLLNSPRKSCFSRACLRLGLSEIANKAIDFFLELFRLLAANLSLRVARDTYGHTQIEALVSMRMTVHAPPYFRPRIFQSRLGLFELYLQRLVVLLLQLELAAQ